MAACETVSYNEADFPGGGVQGPILHAGHCCAATAGIFEKRDAAGNMTDGGSSAECFREGQFHIGNRIFAGLAEVEIFGRFPESFSTRLRSARSAR